MHKFTHILPFTYVNGYKQKNPKIGEEGCVVDFILYCFAHRRGATWWVRCGNEIIMQFTIKQLHTDNHVQGEKHKRFTVNRSYQEKLFFKSSAVKLLEYY